MSLNIEAIQNENVKSDMPDFRAGDTVTVNVKVPKGLTGSQKELLRQFAASMGELDRAGSSSGGGIFGKKKK